MEFRLTTNMEKAIPTQIIFNFDELKTELTEQLAKYEGRVVTEETLKDDKKARADLNKLKKGVR